MTSTANPPPSSDPSSLAIPDDETQDKSLSFLAQARYIISENLITSGAFLLFFLLILFAILGDAIAPYDPLSSNAAIALSPPSFDHWFGTDDLGRDILSRVMVATRLDLGIAVVAVALSFGLGSALGTMAGYMGGWCDRLISRMVDTIMAFPLFILAMGLVAALGNTVENIIYATAVINLP